MCFWEDDTVRQWETDTYILTESLFILATRACICGAKSLKTIKSLFILRLNLQNFTYFPLSAVIVTHSQRAVSTDLNLDNLIMKKQKQLIYLALFSFIQWSRSTVSLALSSGNSLVEESLRSVLLADANREASQVVAKVLQNICLD